MASVSTSSLKTANWFSRIFYLWLSPLLSKGRKQKLEVEDLHDLVDEDLANELTNKLEHEWNKEVSKASPSLGSAIWRTFGCRYFICGCYILLCETMKVAQPILISFFVNILEKKSSSPDHLQVGYLYATAIAVCWFIAPLAQHYGKFGSLRIAMWVRVASSGLVFRKILRLNQEALVNTTSGQIVNLLSNDVKKFDNAFLCLNNIWIFPLQALIAFVFLWQQFGVAILAGYIIGIAVLFFQIIMAKVFISLRKRTTLLTDKRVKFMSELINGIRVIKLYSWEDFFRSQVNRMRSSELRWLQCSFLTSLLARTPYFWIPGVITVVLLGIVFNFNESSFSLVINLQTTMLLLGFLSIIRDATGFIIPSVVLYGAEMRVSVQRLQQILLLPELPMNQNVDVQKFKEISSERSIEMNTLTPKTEGTPLLTSSSFYTKIENTKECGGIVINKVECEKPGVIVQNLSATWCQSEDNKKISCSNTIFNLNKLTFSVTDNELVAIVGLVGAGKSTLLMTLLGELRPCIGRAEIHGKLGYVSQQAWVFSETLRNNILCGQPFEEDRYRNALHCAALSPDLALFRSADQTMVGERGVILSGGQRARVSLARAIYQNADMYLLDDPFSAVDAKVARILFRRCILGELSNKPRILVTHNMQFASQADRIIVLQDGHIAAQGTYKELKNTGVDFRRLDREEDNMKMDYLNGQQNKSSGQELDNESSMENDDIDSLAELNCDFEEERQAVEDTATGKITWKIYLYYLYSGGHPFYLLAIILVYSITQALNFLPDWWLTRWSNNMVSTNTSKTLNSFQSNNSQNGLLNMTTTTFPLTNYNYFMVYIALLLALLVTPVLRCLMFVGMSFCASQVIHGRVLSRLLGAPVLFYDTNPAGRVLNRCSEDIGVVDFLLPLIISDFLQRLFLILCSLLVAIITNFWIILPAVPLFVIFIWLRTYYLSTSTAIKRIESTTRSPIFSHINNTLLGLATVRAMHQETQFTNEFSNIYDRHIRANLLSIGCSRWLALRLDFICATFLTCVVFISIVMAVQLDSGLVGLSLIYSFNIINFCQICVRLSTDVENQMVAVERLLEYTQLEQEEIAAIEPPEDWPCAGSLAFQNVSFKYSVDQPLVLHQINFKINSMEKIGIVGRTGSGKSSLITALFRLAEIQSDGGCILVDDVETRHLSLSLLRSKLSVIPQDPVLFSGTVRHNLDPFGKFEDAQIWRALEEVQLSKVVSVENGGLLHNVVEGGHNFSVGQRQLLCFARALLCQNRILILDEATANIDRHTDALIQSMLRSKFAQCTVLIIAHRLHTVMDCDRLLVLDQGRVVQFDRPNRLLELKSGHFYNLVQSLDSFAHPRKSKL